MYAPDYLIGLPDGGHISLLFNSWTYRAYCQKLGIEYEDLLSKISEGQAFRAKHLPDLLLASAESFAKFNRQEFAADEISAFEWLDALGGFNSDKLADLYKIFVAKLLNVSPEQFDVLWNKNVEQKEEPEKEVKKKSKPHVAPVLSISGKGRTEAKGS